MRHTNEFLRDWAGIVLLPLLLLLGGGGPSKGIEPEASLDVAATCHAEEAPAGPSLALQEARCGCKAAGCACIVTAVLGARIVCPSGLIDAFEVEWTHTRRCKCCKGETDLVVEVRNLLGDVVRRPRLAASPAWIGLKPLIKTKGGTFRVRCAGDCGHGSGWIAF